MRFAGSSVSSRTLAHLFSQAVRRIASCITTSTSRISCARQKGKLLALIDWGDAGWGDPTLEFAAIPFDAVCVALDGCNTTGRLGDDASARVVWDHLQNALDKVIEDPNR